MSKTNTLSQVTVLQAMMYDFSYDKHAHEEYSLVDLPTPD
jgi:hypothetical protein